MALSVWTEEVLTELPLILYGIIIIVSSIDSMWRLKNDAVKKFSTKLLLESTEMFGFQTIVKNHQ